MSSPKKNKTEKRLETLAVKTKSQKEAFLEQLPKYPIVQVACEKSGVGRSTYYAWRKSDKKFAKEADEAITSGTFFINDMAESKLIQNIQNGNNTAIIFWLKNHHGMYNERIMHEHTLQFEELERDDRKAIAKALINIGLGNVIKMNKQELEEATAERAEERERYKHSWDALGKHNPEKEELSGEDEEEDLPPRPQVIAMPKAPAKLVPEKPRIPLSKRKGADINEFFRKREVEKRRLEGK